MAIVHIGIGSNLGDREKNIEDALLNIEMEGIDIIRSSSLIETVPVDGPEQPKFLNGVIQCETDHSPEKLLKILQSIEQKLGRVRTVVNGPRTIDLDILLYDDLCLSTLELTIPHPRMLRREFVMKPLNEVAPDIVLELTSFGKN